MRILRWLGGALRWLGANITSRDLALYGGLIMIGAGVWLWVGPGQGLTASGGLWFLVGVFGISPAVGAAGTKHREDRP